MRQRGTPATFPGKIHTSCIKGNCRNAKKQKFNSYVPILRKILEDGVELRQRKIWDPGNSGGNLESLEKTQSNSCMTDLAYRRKIKRWTK